MMRIDVQVRMQAEGTLAEGKAKQYPNATKAYGIIARSASQSVVCFCIVCLLSCTPLTSTPDPGISTCLLMTVLQVYMVYVMLHNHTDKSTGDRYGVHVIRPHAFVTHADSQL